MVVVVEGLDRALRHIEQFKQAIDRDEGSKRILRVAKAVRVEAEAEGKRAVGADLAFSNWRRGNPIRAAVEAVQVAPFQADVRPKGRVRGQWRVMESGRRSYTAGDKRVAGVRLRKKTNDYALKYRKVKRRVGAMRGWGAWSAGERRMERKARQLHNRDVVGAFRSAFRGR